MSVKLIASHQRINIVGTGYVPPAQIDVIEQFDSLRHDIQLKADEALRQQVEQMRSDFSGQLTRAAAQDRARLETQLVNLESAFQEVAQTMLVQFKQRLEESVSRLWEKEERAQVVARVLRHLANDGLLDADAMVAVPSQHFASTIEALETLNGQDASIVRRCLESVDYLPSNLLVVDATSCSVLIDLDKVTHDLTLSGRC